MSFEAESWLTHVVPSAGQAMMTLVFATFSKRASPGSAKVGASVSTVKKKEN